MADERTTEKQLKEARAILDAVYAMGLGLTMNDRVVFVAECLAKARREGREESARAWREYLGDMNVIHLEDSARAK